MKLDDEEDDDEEEDEEKDEVTLWLMRIIVGSKRSSQLSECSRFNFSRTLLGIVQRKATRRIGFLSSGSLISLVRLIKFAMALRGLVSETLAKMSLKTSNSSRGLLVTRINLLMVAAREASLSIKNGTSVGIALIKSGFFRSSGIALSMKKRSTRCTNWSGVSSYCWYCLSLIGAAMMRRTESFVGEEEEGRKKKVGIRWRKRECCERVGVEWAQARCNYV